MTLILTLSVAKGKDLLSRLGPTIRRVVGMPNYDAYIAHLRAHHPECQMPTEREYYDLYLEGKYNGEPGNRCC